MYKPEQISLSDARYLMLSNQMLLGKHPVRTRKDLLKVIEKIGYVQIDTISIIERAHKHVLWTRFPGYNNIMLDELIDKDKKVFEFWDHAAAYIPMKYYRYTLPRKQRYAMRHKEWAKKNKKLLKNIIDRITSEGPLQSRDFEDPKKRGLWWDWKPAKEALEYLFHTGKLSARSRKSFQKVYDLTERTLPDNIDISMPTYKELTRHLVLKEINTFGFAAVKEMFFQRHHNKDITKKVLEEMLEGKEIIPIAIEGISSEKFYSTRKNLKDLNNKSITENLHILTPFDNLIIQRSRVKRLFNFDYTLECYVPAPKRKFGYFCLPIISGERFIGKLDAKADRASGEFRVINMFWEEGFGSAASDEAIFEKLVKKVNELAQFSGCNTVVNFP